MVTLSIIIPTIGRPTLLTLLRELVPQLMADDDVFVVGDGDQPEARKVVVGMDARVHYREVGPTRCWGHPQRNWAMSLARGSHLMSLDDDDALKPDALGVVRRVVAECPAVPVVFRMQHGSFHLWREKTLTCGNVSTQMFVVPNNKAQLGQWGHRYEGDYDFIRSTCERYAGKERAIVWREEVIALHGIGGSDPRR